MGFLGRYEDEIRGVFRIVVGLLFMQHGAQKLFGMFGGMGGSGATAELFSMMGLAGVLEFFGGLLIVLGLLTRVVAIVLAGQMAVAYFMAHLPQGFWPIQNGGELAAFFSWTFLYFAAAGPGAFSVDRALGREPRTERAERSAAAPRTAERVG